MNRWQPMTIAFMRTDLQKSLGLEYLDLQKWFLLEPKLFPEFWQMLSDGLDPIVVEEFFDSFLKPRSNLPDDATITWIEEIDFRRLLRICFFSKTFAPLSEAQKVPEFIFRLVPEPGLEPGQAEAH